MARQTALKSAQANVHSQIVSNIRDLVREKAVIAAGNRELMEMTENIQQRLGADFIPLITFLVQQISVC